MSDRAPKAIKNWELICPAPLLPAVEGVRRKFNSHSWRCAKSTERLCYAALHRNGPGEFPTSNQDELREYRRYLIQLCGKIDLPRGEDGPSKIFKWYREAYRTGLMAITATIFEELRDIGTKQQKLLKSDPIAWAKSHLAILLAEQRARSRSWIKAACDRPQVPKHETDLEELINWRTWRAPRLIHKNANYDAKTGWSREDAVGTEARLDGLTKDFVLDLTLDLEEIAQTSHIARAKELPTNVVGRPATFSRRSNSRKLAIDPRKELIARIKGRHEGIYSREICGRMDKHIERISPALSNPLWPLPDWIKKADGQRSWIGVFDHKKTHQLVRAYVNKVPALKTS